MAANAAFVRNSVNDRVIINDIFFIMFLYSIKLNSVGLKPIFIHPAKIKRVDYAVSIDVVYDIGREPVGVHCGPIKRVDNPIVVYISRF